MKKYFYVLILLFGFFSCTLTRKSKLTGHWKIDKTVEQFNQYKKTYKDSIYYRGGRRVKSINVLGGHITFNDDQTAEMIRCLMYWNIQKKILQVDFQSDSSCGRDFRNNNYFFGEMEFLNITDSSVILHKKISQDGKWTRTFYLRREDYEE